MIRRSFVGAVMVIASAACASSGPGVVQQAPTPQQTISTMPSWMTKVPQDPNFVFAPATATSPDMQVALDMATGDARNKVAQQLEVKYNSLAKSFQEQTGLAADAELLKTYTNTWKAIVSQVLVGSRPREQEVRPEGGIYRAFVLVEMPVGRASEELMSKMKANQQMYTRFRASQAFQELDAEVQKYQDWKKSQANP